MTDTRAPQTPDSDVLAHPPKASALSLVEQFSEPVMTLPRASAGPFAADESVAPIDAGAIDRAVRKITDEVAPAFIAAPVFPASASPSPSPSPSPAPAPAPAPDLASPSPSPDQLLRSVADYCVRAATKGPLRIGLFGPAGCGKSFALSRILADVAAMKSQTLAQTIVVARVDASQGRAPACTLASAVYAAMNAPGASPALASLAEQAAFAGADAQEAARTAADRLIETRRKLESERQALQELAGRNAQLGETILYQAGGSRVDSWARANRPRIEGRLRAFGFDAPDPVAAYKDLVRDVSDRRGHLGRAGVYLQAMWGFRGQARLLTFAAMFLALAWGLGKVQASQPEWLGWMRQSGDFFASIAGWMQAKGDLPGLLRSLSLWGAFGLVALNVLRALQFVAPLNRGAALLAADVQTGQRNLDAMIGQQTRLVDGLAAEVEAQARLADACERRAALQGDASSSGAATPFDDGADASVRQARAFFSEIAHRLEHDGSSAPLQKVLVAVDDLDALSPHAAAHFVDEAARALDSSPFILLAAADPRRLAAGWARDLDEASGRERLSARVHAALYIGAASQDDLATMARRLLAPVVDQDAGSSDGAVCLRDEPLSAQEMSLIEGLASFAARTPRDVERFVLTWRLARLRTPDHGALALALALEMGASSSQKRAWAEAIASARDDDSLQAPQAEARIADALTLARKAGPIRIGAWRKAQAIAADYYLPGA